MEVEDFVRQLGPLGLTMRLQRIVDRMIADARVLYKELGLDIKPNWHAVLLLMKQYPDIGVAEVGKRLGIAHPSASVLVKQLEKSGYVVRRDDPNDRRRQVLNLTPLAKRRLPKLEKIWKAAERAIHSTLKELEVDFVKGVDGFENAILKSSFRDRTLKKIS